MSPVPEVTALFEKGPPHRTDGSLDALALVCRRVRVIRVLGDTCGPQGNLLVVSVRPAERPGAHSPLFLEALRGTHLDISL